MIKLFEYNEVEFNSNGIKILSPTSVKIKRSLFDYEFQLEMCHPLNDKGLEIKEDRIIQYTDEKMGTQYFRIENIRKSLHEVEVTANSIFFDLNKNFIEDVNVVNKSGNMAIVQLLNATTYSHNFSGNSNIAVKNNLRCIRKNVVSALLGSEDNTFINRWGGELDIDGFSFKINDRIGEDNGYSITYGKNLKGLDLKLDMANVVTKIRPVGFDGLEIEGKYVDSPYINRYAMPIIKEYKYENVKWTGSPNYEEKQDDDSFIFDSKLDAQNKLIELATLEFTKNEIDLPNLTVDVDFIELSQTEEYKKLSMQFLQQLSIGDTVHIRKKPLILNFSARCIDYIYDGLKHCFESITIGCYTKNFFTQTQDNNEKIESDVIEGLNDVITDALINNNKHLNDVINNALGG